MSAADARILNHGLGHDVRVCRDGNHANSGILKLSLSGFPEEALQGGIGHEMCVDEADYDHAPLLKLPPASDVA